MRNIILIVILERMPEPSSNRATKGVTKSSRTESMFGPSRPFRRFRYPENAHDDQKIRCKILNFVNNINVSTFQPTYPEMNGGKYRENVEMRIVHEECYLEILLNICITTRNKEPEDPDRWELPPYRWYAMVLPSPPWGSNLQKRVEVDVPVVKNKLGYLEAPKWQDVVVALKRRLDDFETNGKEKRVALR